MKISRFNSSISEQDIKYPYLVPVFSGNKRIGEIEMETSNVRLAYERWQEQALEVWQNTEFNPEQVRMNELARPAEKVYRYLKEAVRDCYTPVAKDIKQLAILCDVSRNSTQRAIKLMKDYKFISSHQARGRGKNLYIKI